MPLGVISVLSAPNSSLLIPARNKLLQSEAGSKGFLPSLPVHPLAHSIQLIFLLVLVYFHINLINYPNNLFFTSRASNLNTTISCHLKQLFPTGWTANTSYIIFLNHIMILLICSIPALPKKRKFLYKNIYFSIALFLFY